MSYNYQDCVQIKLQDKSLKVKKVTNKAKNEESSQVGHMIFLSTALIN